MLINEQTTTHGNTGEQLGTARYVY